MGNKGGGERRGGAGRGGGGQKEDGTFRRELNFGKEEKDPLVRREEGGEEVTLSFSLSPC